MPNQTQAMDSSHTDTQLHLLGHRTGESCSDSLFGEKTIHYLLSRAVLLLEPMYLTQGPTCTAATSVSMTSATSASRGGWRGTPSCATSAWTGFRWTSGGMAGTDMTVHGSIVSCYPHCQTAKLLVSVVGSCSSCGWLGKRCLNANTLDTRNGLSSKGKE